LRKISEHSASHRVNLFGEQTHVIAAGKQSAEKFAGLHIATLQ
jgi:hypothetical protein